MSLLLHAITTTPDASVAAAAGLRGSPLASLDVGGVTAWYTSLPTDPGAFTKEDMLQHHRLVTEVFNRVEGCLPARFPTLVADEGVVRSQLKDRATVLATQLDVVRGACEIAVTLVWRGPQSQEEEVQAARPGRRYLLRRAKSQRFRDRANELADVLEEEVGADLLEAKRQVCPSAQVALSLALLVKRAVAGTVRERLGGDLGGDVRILVNGPWAPYTFADARPIASRER